MRANATTKHDKLVESYPEQTSEMHRQVPRHQDASAAGYVLKNAKSQVIHSIHNFHFMGGHCPDCNAYRAASSATIVNDGLLDIWGILILLY